MTRNPVAAEHVEAAERAMSVMPDLSDAMGEAVRQGDLNSFDGVTSTSAFITDAALVHAVLAVVALLEELIDLQRAQRSV